MAVDARWLERTLKEHYNPQKEAWGGTASPEPGHRFTAHNYLGKFFRIPFTLPVMEAPGYPRHIAGIIASPRKQAERMERHLEVSDTDRAWAGN